MFCDFYTLTDKNIAFTLCQHEHFVLPHRPSMDAVKISHHNTHKKKGRHHLTDKSNQHKSRKLCEGRRVMMETLMYSHLLLSVYLNFVYFVCFSLPLTCELGKKFHLNEMHKPGDVVLGGLFEVHYTSVFPEQTFTSEPQQPICKG